MLRPYSSQQLSYDSIHCPFVYLCWAYIGLSVVTLWFFFSIFLQKLYTTSGIEGNAPRRLENWLRVGHTCLWRRQRLVCIRTRFSAAAAFVVTGARLPHTADYFRRRNMSPPPPLVSSCKSCGASIVRCCRRRRSRRRL